MYANDWCPGLHPTVLAGMIAISGGFGMHTNS